MCERSSALLYRIRLPPCPAPGVTPTSAPRFTSPVATTQLHGDGPQCCPTASPHSGPCPCLRSASPTAPEHHNPLYGSGPHSCRTVQRHRAGHVSTSLYRTLLPPCPAPEAAARSTALQRSTELPAAAHAASACKQTCTGIREVGREDRRWRGLCSAVGIQDAAPQLACSAG